MIASIFLGGILLGIAALIAAVFISESKPDRCASPPLVPGWDEQQ
jgi:hypothetical protein